VNLVQRAAVVAAGNLEQHELRPSFGAGQVFFQVVQPLEMRRAADRVFVDPALMAYGVRLATATRRPEAYGLPDLKRYITYGASPRASINLTLTARALAFVRGRDYALPEDMRDMALDVLRHRLVLSFEALSDDVTSDQILRQIIDRVPVPVVPLRTDDRVRAGA